MLKIKGYWWRYKKYNVKVIFSLGNGEYFEESTTEKNEKQTCKFK